MRPLDPYPSEAAQHTSLVSFVTQPLAMYGSKHGGRETLLFAFFGWVSWIAGFMRLKIQAIPSVFAFSVGASLFFWITIGVPAIASALVERGVDAADPWLRREAKMVSTANLAHLFLVAWLIFCIPTSMMMIDWFASHDVGRITSVILVAIIVGVWSIALLVTLKWLNRYIYRDLNSPLLAERLLGLATRAGSPIREVRSIRHARFRLAFVGRTWRPPCGRQLTLGAAIEKMFPQGEIEALAAVALVDNGRVGRPNDERALELIGQPEVLVRAIARADFIGRYKMPPVYPEDSHELSEKARRRIETIRLFTTKMGTGSKMQ